MYGYVTWSTKCLTHHRWFTKLYMGGHFYTVVFREYVGETEYLFCAQWLFPVSSTHKRQRRHIKKKISDHANKEQIKQINNLLTNASIDSLLWEKSFFGIRNTWRPTLSVNVIVNMSVRLDWGEMKFKTICGLLGASSGADVDESGRMTVKIWANQVVSKRLMWESQV